MKFRPKQARQQAIVTDILTERRRQDRQWGGDKHDDTHTAEDFAYYIETQTFKMRQSTDGDGPRLRMIKIAALAMAAVEMLDRVETPTGGTR